MKKNEENEQALINPHIVGWYLVNELKELRVLKRQEEKELSQLRHPYYAKTLDEINFFAMKYKQILYPLKSKLVVYNKSFDDDAVLGYEDVVNYFAEQLIALNAKKMIDRDVVDLAYAAHEQAENNKVIEAGKMGKRLCEFVSTGPKVAEKEHVSEEITTAKPVISLDKPVSHSRLPVESATFVPISQSPPFNDSTPKVSLKIVKPKQFRRSLFRDLKILPSIPEEPWESVTLLPTQPSEDVDFEQSRLFRFWRNTNNQDDVDKEHCSIKTI
jgi:hypothetical protein